MRSYFAKRSSHSAQDDRGLPLGAAALLVFLARTARAGVVAANLGAAAHYLLHSLRFSGSSHPSLLQLAPLLALERHFEFVNGGGHVSRRAIAITIRPCAVRLSCSHCCRALQDLHQVEISCGLFLKPRHHGLEHVEGFPLVLDQRIVLPVAT